MRAREIEKWLAKILEHGAVEMADAEVARHIARVWQLVEAMDQKFRPRDARAELIGYDDTMGELHVSHVLLKTRARESEKAFAARQAEISGRALSSVAPAGVPAGAP